MHARIFPKHELLEPSPFHHRSINSCIAIIHHNEPTNEKDSIGWQPTWHPDFDPHPRLHGVPLQPLYQTKFSRQSPRITVPPPPLQVPIGAQPNRTARS